MTPTEAIDHWLRQVVVGQNFCPFAGKPLANGEIVLQEVLASNIEEVLLSCHTVLESFRKNESQETLLFVLPKGFSDFMDFLDLADTFELMLEDSFGDELSLATFHPEYQFAEFAPDDVVHHIHRSPYPILHVLREDSIDLVREGMEDTTAITARNHAHAKTLGVSFFQQFKA
ncbi:MAG: DUF1415 family protein [Saprospiraceae bacterium]